MLRLTVVRHADAVAATAGGADFDRTLSSRGVQQAREAARWLVASRANPDRILTSTAPRARETARLLLEHGLGKASLQPDPRLYLASPAALLPVLHETAPAVAHLLLVGHNPGVSELCRLLSGDLTLAELGTAGFCSLWLDLHSWSQLRAGIATLI